MTQVNALLAPHGLALVMTDDTTGYVAVVEHPEASPLSIQTNDLIEEMLVIAPYRIERRNARRQSLTSQQLKLLPSVGRDTLRGIKVLPGVASDGLSAKHRFRGGDDNEVLYRLDGINLYEPFHFSDVQNLFTAVNPNVIDSVDVYVTRFPVDFGTRMSGVVDLHLVEAEQPLQATVDINFLAAAADVRGYQSNWSWLLSGRVSLVGRVIDVVQSQSEENLDIPGFNDQLARLGWSNERNEVVFGVLRSDESIDIERESTGERGQGDYQYEDVWVRWDHDFSDAISMRWQANWFDAKRDRLGTSERRIDALGRLNESRTFSIVSLSNQWRWLPPRSTEFLAGWSIARHKADFNASLSAAYGVLGQPIQGTSTEDRSLEFGRSGPSTHAFVSMTQDLGTKVSATLGVRYDAQDIAEVDVSEWSGRLAVTYALAKDWGVTFDVGRYTQQQFLHEIQIDEGRTELDPPQHADQINVGLVWTPTDALQFRADLFRRKIANPWTRFDNVYNRVVLLPELHGDRYLIEASEARAQGAEIAVSYQRESLNWNLSYAYSVSEERVGGDWHKRSWDQPHIVKAGFSWEGSKWRAGISATYRNGWPITDLVTNPDQLPSTLNRDRLPNYFSLDVHVGRTFDTPTGKFETYLDVTNLTNHTNPSGYLYQEDLTRDESRLLPIIPSIGVTWTWP